MSEKPWDGRFEAELKEEVLDYTVGDDITLDQKLIMYDIIGTEAHDIMLYKVGILKPSSIKNILIGLEKLKELYKNGKFVLEKQFEDVHMNIERAMINYIGEEDGGNIHIARSRNDQILLDLRLYMRDEIIKINESLIELIEILINKASENLETIMPGYTHFQHAQPITFGHWCMAYVDAFIRDFERLSQIYKRINQSPLGAAAIAGVSWKINRKMVADLLGFEALQENTLDCISNRGEFISELLNICSIIMVHLSKIAEDLILWSTYEFRMIELDDAYSTGSSIMPQKKNPDVCELIRARTGIVISLLNQVLNIIKGLPSGYNRDYQETKYPLIKGIEITKKSINIMKGTINTLKINKQRMAELVKTNFISATELMDYLVKNGIPLRTAHKVVGKFIRKLIKNSIYPLDKIDVKLFKDVVKEELNIDINLTQEELNNLLDVEKIIRRRNLIGGPAPEEVSRMIKNRNEKLLNLKEYNFQVKKKLESVYTNLNKIINSIIEGGK